MSQYILKNGPWDMYISFHSYSQLILLPWGWTNDLPDDYKEMYRVADKAAKSLRSLDNSSYTVGTPTKLLCKYLDKHLLNKFSMIILKIDNCIKLFIYLLI